MAAIPYASATARPVPSINIPFRAIIASSSSSSSSSPSSQQRTPSPSSASASFANPLGSSPLPNPASSTPVSATSPRTTSSSTATSTSTSTSASNLTVPRSAACAGLSSLPTLPPASSVTASARTPQHQHHHTYSQPMYSAGRRSRRAARGPEVFAGGRRAGTRDIDDDVASLRSTSSSSTAELPAYFVDPSLPQYEYRARPVWVGPGLGAGVHAEAGGGGAHGPASGSPLGRIAPLAPLTSSATPASSGSAIPATPERRILGLPNRNSPPVPPRSLPDTSGLSVLRGSSLIASEASPTSSSNRATTCTSAGPSLAPSPLVTSTPSTSSRGAAPAPPAYEERDSRRGSAADAVMTTVQEETATNSLQRSQSANNVGQAAMARSPQQALPSSATMPAPPVASSNTAVAPVPPVPTRSVSLPSTASSGTLPSSASVANTGSSSSNKKPSNPSRRPSQVVVSQGDDAVHAMALDGPTALSAEASSSSRSRADPERNNATILPQPSVTIPPPASITAAPAPPTPASQVPQRRPFSTILSSNSVPQMSTLSAASGLAWGMFGISLGYSANPTQSLPSPSASSAMASTPPLSTAAPASCSAPPSTTPAFASQPASSLSVTARQVNPTPSERRSSRAVGRHMRAATSFLGRATGSSSSSPATGGAAATSGGSSGTLRNRSSHHQLGVYANENHAGASMASTGRTGTNRAGSASPAVGTNHANTNSNTSAGSAPGASASPAELTTLLGLSAREWALRLAWLGEQDAGGAGGGASSASAAGAGVGVVRERRGASISAL